MSFIARHELLGRITARYRLGNRKQKRMILDEFIESTGYARKYAIRLLSGSEDQSVSITRQRLRWYGPEVEEALVTVWNSANGICAKRLIPFLPELVTALESHGHLSVSEDTRSKLLTLSAATADRMLTRLRGKRAGKSTTKAGQLLKHQVPIRTFADWQDSRPGFMEADLVAHCGERTDGGFLNTLVLTDVATGWTECMPLLCKSEEEVMRALRLARQQLLPFSLLGLDTDNGSEFLNDGLLTYCRNESITFTRGRAYRKNDQCYVEQKNGSVVRQLVGYDRFEGHLACRQLAELYRVIRLYVNYFQPSMKLVTKKRDGAKVTKTYDAARTPYQRLVGSGHLAETMQEQLRSSYHALDPVDLLRQLERLQDAFWQHAQVARPRITLTDKTDSPPAAMPEISELVPELKRQRESHGNVSSLSVPIAAQEQRSRRKYRRSEKPRVPHTWRTRKDPFESVWDEVQQRLQLAPELTAKTIFIELQEKYPNGFSRGQLRTLQRRVKQWRRQVLVTFDMEWTSAPVLAPI